MRAARLGDDIDDFCVKCKRVMNHAVVSILNDEPAKVRCRTCHSDHDFRHEQAPPPKVDARKAALFSQVLANVTGTQEPVAAGIEAAAAAARRRVLVEEFTVDPAMSPKPSQSRAPAVEAAAPAKPKARKKAKA